MFTKLLVAQIQNQDPLEPTDPSQFVNQLTQLSQTESLQTLASQATASASLLQSLQALALGAQVARTSASPPTACASTAARVGRLHAAERGVEDGARARGRLQPGAPHRSRHAGAGRGLLHDRPRRARAAPGSYGVRVDRHPRPPGSGRRHAQRRACLPAGGVVDVTHVGGHSLGDHRFQRPGAAIHN
jgi:hypothetical protein